ncbi:hypothetical protein OSTOST_04852 [Ostertagia ostertagi]
MLVLDSRRPSTAVISKMCSRCSLMAMAWSATLMRHRRQREADDHARHHLAEAQRLALEHGHHQRVLRQARHPVVPARLAARVEQADHRHQRDGGDDEGAAGLGLLEGLGTDGHGHQQGRQPRGQRQLQQPEGQHFGPAEAELGLQHVALQQPLRRHEAHAGQQRHRHAEQRHRAPLAGHERAAAALQFGGNAVDAAGLEHGRLRERGGEGQGGGERESAPGGEGHDRPPGIGWPAVSGRAARWPAVRGWLATWCVEWRLTAHERRRMLRPHPRRGLSMQTLDEMRDRCLLTPQQHADIGAWVSQARTPEGHPGDARGPVAQRWSWPAC